MDYEEDSVRPKAQTTPDEWLAFLLERLEEAPEILVTDVYLLQSTNPVVPDKSDEKI